MNVARLLTSTGTLHRLSDSGTDAYNNPTTTTTNVTVACWIEQASSTEDEVSASIDTDVVKVYMDTTADPVTGRDSITVDGTTYGFTGPGWLAVNPRTGVASHVEAKARRVA